MRVLFALLLAFDGAIDVMGFLKARGLAEVTPLRRHNDWMMSLLWLTAAVLLLGAAVILLAAPRFWWWPAALAVVLSQCLALGGWDDRRPRRRHAR